MDSLGHVNNVTYADYMQEARVDMLAKHPELLGGAGGRTGTIVVSHDITYHRPLVFRPAPVTIEVWVAEIRRASFVLAYLIRDDGDDQPPVYARGQTVLAPFDVSADRPRRLSEAELSVLESYRDHPQEPAR